MADTEITDAWLSAFLDKCFVVGRGESDNVFDFDDLFSEVDGEIARVVAALRSERTQNEKRSRDARESLSAALVVAADLSAELERERTQNRELLWQSREALRLTREYCWPTVQLQAIEGWSWWDATVAIDQALGRPPTTDEMKAPATKYDGGVTADLARAALSTQPEPAPEPQTDTRERCEVVLAYDDSIGGEGVIRCNWPLGENGVCANPDRAGHRLIDAALSTQEESKA